MLVLRIEKQQFGFADSAAGRDLTIPHDGGMED